MRTHLFVAACLLLSCLDPATHTCSDGLECASGYVCAEARGECALPEQLTACADRGDGESCYVSATDGICEQGFCRFTQCTDGVVDPIEDCEADVITLDCVALGFDRGRLSCSDTCSYLSDDCESFAWTEILTGGLTYDIVRTGDGAVFSLGEPIFSGGGTVRRHGDGEAVVVLDEPNLALQSAWRVADDLIFAGGKRRVSSGGAPCPPCSEVWQWNGDTWSHFDDGPAEAADLLQIWADDTELFVASSRSIYRRAGGEWGQAELTVEPFAVMDELVRAGDRMYAAFDNAAGPRQVFARDPIEPTWTDITPSGAGMTSLSEFAGILYAGNAQGNVLTYTPADGSNTPADGWKTVYSYPAPADEALTSMWSTGSELFVAGFETILRFDGASWVQLDAVERSIPRRMVGVGSDLVVLNRFGQLQRGPGNYGWLTPASLFELNPAPTNPKDRYLSLSGAGRDLSASWTSPDGVEFFAGSRALYIGIAGHALQRTHQQQGFGFSDVWGRSATDVYAVGGAVTFGSTGKPTVLHYQGPGLDASWQEVVGVPRSDENGQSFFAIAGTATGIFVAGSNGRVAHYDGESWMDLSIAGSPSVASLLLHRDILYAQTATLNGNGTLDTGLYRLAKDQWTANTEGWQEVVAVAALPAEVFALWGNEDTDIFLAGSGDDGRERVFVLDAADNVTEFVLPGSSQIKDISGTAANDLFALTRAPDSDLLHFDGVGWSRIRINMDATFSGVHATADSVRLVGQDGAATLLLRR